MVRRLNLIQDESVDTLIKLPGIETTTKSIAQGFKQIWFQGHTCSRLLWALWNETAGLSWQQGPLLRQAIAGFLFLDTSP